MLIKRCITDRKVTGLSSHSSSRHHRFSVGVGCSKPSEKGRISLCSKTAIWNLYSENSNGSYWCCSVCVKLNTSFGRIGFYCSTYFYSEFKQTCVTCCWSKNTCVIFKDLWFLCILNIRSQTWLLSIGGTIIQGVLWPDCADLVIHFTGITSFMLNLLTFFYSHSKRQRQGRNYHKQNIFTDFWAADQADQPVWPGHHPHPQAFPLKQPQHPGPVAPLHQPAPLCRPHPTGENGL